jgi:type VI secretion system ImpC/EvpB family protein/type VI secretion system ImpB/VipA family protein
MKYEVSFGQPIDSDKAISHGPENSLRVAILGDFSGRANTGNLSIGDELAKRKPHRVDVDNLDDVLARFAIKLALPIANDGGIVNVSLNSMDDFHPDELYDRLQVFEKLSSLRSRLQNSSSFEGAAKVVKSLLGQSAIDKQQSRKRKSSSTTVPNRKFEDFESIINETRSPNEEAPIVDLLKQVVGSFVIDDPDPQQDQFIATVDEAVSDTMRRVLHHPDFQAMESLWRSVELMVRRLETGNQLHLVLYDVTAEELAADLSASDNLEESGLFRMLVEQPSLDAQQGPLSLILGSYVFEQTPPHADLLGRMSQIANAAHAPFIASISNDCLKKKSIEEVHPLVKESWDALKSHPNSAYLMLTVPNFMLRWPYGKKSDPIDPFEFEEFTDRGGVSTMLWANGCFLAGLLLCKTCQEQGKSSMKLGSFMTMDDLPFYYYVDEYGDQIPFPCTNRLLSESLVAHVVSQNFAPVIGIKGRPEVRLGSFKSLFGQLLTGSWGDRPDSSTGASPSPVVQGETDDSDSSSDSDMDAMLSDDSDSDSDSDSDLSALMNEMGDDSDSSDEDDDLAALLGSMDSDDDDDDDDEMDPELAALLNDM